MPYRSDERLQCRVPRQEIVVAYPGHRAFIEQVGRLEAMPFPNLR